MNIPDAGLEAAVRGALGIPVDDILCRDMEGLTELFAGEQGIQSLSGLEGAVNLTGLGLWSNQISDLTPLARLTNLTSLDLVWNQVSDLTPLASLTNLTVLGLGWNQISDLTPLVANPGLGSGDRVSLEWNFLDLAPGSQAMNDINTLLARGVGLSYEWQRRPLLRVCPNPDEVVNIPDAALEAAVREELSIPVGDLLCRNLEDLWWLHAARRDIQSLSGLERAVNLTLLWLWGNQISDLTPLAGLTNLQQLNLGSNQISDLTPLARLTNLMELGLGYNQISDLTPLAGLTNLMELDLGYNQISDLTPLANLTNLTSLWLFENQISDLTPLVANPGLGSGDSVSLGWNFLDLTPGSQAMTDINALLARGVDVIFEPQRRPQLRVCHNPEEVVNIPDAALEAAVREELGTSVGDILCRDMESLTQLSASSRGVQNLSGLEGAVNLTSLWLGYNQISDLTPLANLTSLTWLWLDENQISDLAPLANLTNLTTGLSLESNQLSDLAPLAGLTNLTRLWLGSNQISDLAPLANLTNLTGLSLGSWSEPLGLDHG